ncbi:hypothetical protein EOM81_13360 [bacterium]|nr:hypothetical protein [bacterium]
MTSSEKREEREYIKEEISALCDKLKDLRQEHEEAAESYCEGDGEEETCDDIMSEILKTVYEIEKLKQNLEDLC